MDAEFFYLLTVGFFFVVFFGLPLYFGIRLIKAIIRYLDRH